MTERSNGIWRWVLGLALAALAGSVGVIYSGVNQKLERVAEEQMSRTQRISILEEANRSTQFRLQRIEDKLDTILARLPR